MRPAAVLIKILREWQEGHFFDLDSKAEDVEERLFFEAYKKVLAREEESKQFAEKYGLSNNLFLANYIQSLENRIIRLESEIEFINKKLF